MLPVVRDNQERQRQFGAANGAAQHASRSWFFLQPINRLAATAVRSARNQHLWVHQGDNRIALGLGPHIPSYTPGWIVLGRGAWVNIRIEHPAILRYHCSFEFKLGLIPPFIVLCDDSHAGQTFLPGAHTTFVPDRPRRIVLAPFSVVELGLGGTETNALLQFKLVWAVHMRTLEFVSIRGELELRDSLGRTLELRDSLGRRTLEHDALSTSNAPDPNVALLPDIRVRYSGQEPLGNGSYGQVFKAINIDTAEIIAVKLILAACPRGLLREVEAISQLKHRHIVECLGWKATPSKGLEIFMPLKDGSLSALVAEVRESSELAWIVFDHILQALDFIASRGFMH